MSVFDKISGIPVASGFKLQAKAPLDPRLVVASIADRNSLITENGAYEGMQVYVKDDKKTYCLKDLTAGTWSEVGGGGSGDGVTSVVLSGDGNAVTSASISGSQLTLTKDSTFLTSHQSLADCAKLSEGNTFTGSSNKFGSSEYGCTISDASSGSPFCLKGNANNSMQLDFYNSQILFKDARHVNYGTTLQADMSADYGTANATITLPRKTGTLALTDYVTANPTADGTTELTKLQVGDTVYTLPSGGGSGGGSGGIYVHVISFDFTESLNSSTCKGVITITNSSNDNFIVDTNISSNSLTNLTNFLSNINNSFYPLATTNTTGSNLPYIGISYNSDSSEYVVYSSDTSTQTAPVSITIDDTTFVETVVQTSTGGSGGGGSGDVTAAGDNTFTGTNTFAKRVTFAQGITNRSFMTISPTGATDPTKPAPYAIYDYGTITLKAPGVTGSDKVRTLTLPTSASGTLALTSDIDVTAAGNNVFTGDNSFKNGIYIKPNAGPPELNTFCGINKNGLLVYSSVSGLTSTKTISVPMKEGTLALTDYVTANPTADGTTELTKLQVGDTVYTLPNGGGSTSIAEINENIVKDPSKTYLIWHGNTFPNSTSATFKAPANSVIDWGDGTVQTFTTASTAVNTHTYTDGITYHLIVISGLTAIADRAFNTCNGLVDITFSSRITTIGDYAFTLCSNLGSRGPITIPASISSIGQGAFKNNANLKTLIFENTTPITYTPNMIQSSTKIQVKNRTAYRLYSNESGWSNIYYSLTNDALFPLLTDEVVPLSSGEVQVKLDTPDTTGMYVLSSIGDPIKTSLTIPVMDLTQNKNFYIFGTVHTSENTYVDKRIQCTYIDSNNTLIISIIDHSFYNTTYKMYKVFRT